MDDMKSGELVNLLRHNEVFVDSPVAELVEQRPAVCLRLKSETSLRQLLRLCDLLCIPEEDVRLARYDPDGFAGVRLVGFEIDDLEIPLPTTALERARDANPALRRVREGAQLGLIPEDR
jgi:hypothetical protein